MLTGEPLPVEKTTDSEVAAGTMNQHGSFLFRATRIGRDTALGLEDGRQVRVVVQRDAVRLERWIPG